MEVKPGLFISCEGIEGVGKSTNLTFIKNWLEEKGIKVVATREPGGTPLAEKLREILLLDWEENIAPQTELMLLFAGRKQHITNLINPNINKGNWVLSDRFTDATYAYQGYGRGIPIEDISRLEKSVQNTLKPDVTFLFDMPVDIAQSRLVKRMVKKDRIEKEKLDFFEKVRFGYLTMAKIFPTRFKIIDANRELPAIWSDLSSELEIIFANYKSEK